MVIGTISNPTDSVITFGDETVPLNDRGEFYYKVEWNKPSDIVVVYNNTEILLYLAPSGELTVTFDGSDMINTIRFAGEEADMNNFLVSLARQSMTVSPWFDENWYNLYTKKEEDFIEVIDSLQDTFLDIFDHFKSNHGFRDTTFINHLIADTWFSFNRLILLYPSQYESFTGDDISLSNTTIDRLTQTNIDDPGFIDLDHYESYCRDWIDYNLNENLKTNESKRNYYLNRMDELFRLLPEMFSSPEVRDFWLAGYLSGHIERYGISNSNEYISRFNDICVTPKYRQQVEKALREKSDASRDHSVEVYKTVNGFNLEAHIFLPGTGTPEKKVPGIVLFHGGGWADGNPSWLFSRARHFAGKGMIAVSAQYRLSNQADITPIEGMEDARDIIRWMRMKADSLGLIPDSIVAYGYSAGGHLAAATAIFPGPDAGEYSAEPDALVLVSPALDLVNDGWSQYLLGSRADAGSISPAEHVRKNLPPTVILQGRDDTVTPLKGAQLFYNRMIAAGNDCELWIYDEVGHLFTPNTMRDDGWPRPDPHIQQEAFEQADEFLKKRGYMR